jgi:glycosyltransferase involved in cell wall biosynthesis
MTDSGRLRILYVISGLTRGGAERQLYLLLKHLDRRHFEPAVVSLAGGGALAADIRALGVPLFELPRRGHADVRRLSRLCRVVSAFAPHVVQTFLLPDTLYGFIAGWLAAVPVLVTSRRTDQYGEFPLHMRALNRIVWRRADAVICNSRRAVDYLPARLAARHAVIHNGVEPLEARAEHGAVRRALGLPAGAPVVGTVGRVVTAKNHVRFVEVARAVLAERPDSRFVIVGGGPLEHEVRALIAAHGLEGRVLLTGERGDVGDLLRALDVFLLTSDREGLCNAVMEAMMSGLPCVVTDVGGNRELVADGETGFVCAPTVPALAAATRRLLDDAPCRRRLGEAGRRRMEEHFSPAACARATEALYRRLLLARTSTALAAPAPSRRAEKVAR